MAVGSWHAGEQLLPQLLGLHFDPLSAKRMLSTTGGRWTRMKRYMWAFLPENTQSKKGPPDVTGMEPRSSREVYQCEIGVGVP